MLGLGHIKENIFVLSLRWWVQTIAKFENMKSHFLPVLGAVARLALLETVNPRTLSSFTLLVLKHWLSSIFRLAFEWHVSCCVVSLALFFLLPPFQGAESSDMGCSSPSSSSTTPIPTGEWGSLACRIHASLSAS